MVCETGVNSPALRAENLDKYLDTAQFLKLEDMKGQSIIEEEDDIEAVEEAVSEEEEDEDEGEDTASDVVDEEEQE